MGSTSAYRGIVLPTVAGDSGIWGTELNTTITGVDAILGSQSTFPSSTYGTNITPSSSQAQVARMTVTSTGAGPFTLNLKSSVFAIGLYNVSNQTQGALTVTTGLGTTVSLTANSGSFVFSDGTNVSQTIFSSSAPPATKTRTVITSGSGTYLTPAGCTAILVRMIGGGGGGGGCPDPGPAPASTVGSGGASGAYCEKLIVNPNSSYAYAIGAAGAGGVTTTGGNGGMTTFGTSAFLAAPGGNGGLTMGAGNNGWALAGGATGVVATGGDINYTGSPGQAGVIPGNNICMGGAGAASVFGGGGSGITKSGVATNGVNSPATSYGSGGGGGATNLNGVGTTGGAGAGGVIDILEYYY